MPASRFVSGAVLIWGGVWLLGALVLGPGLAAAQVDDARGVKPAPAGPGEGRVALVIGNAAYTDVAPLQNPVHDAVDMGRALERLGFEVLRRVDQSRAEMYAAVRTFAEKARGAEVALLFYAGHGIEVEGDNYLLPVDVDDFADGGSRIDAQAVGLSDVLRALQRASTQVVVLDACRSNPFPDGVADDGSTGGWAVPSGDAMGGTLVVYGTAPGAVASDNVQGRNGLFTEALLAELEQPGIEAAEMMRRVTRRVREASRHAQSPWISASYVLPFYFHPPAEVAPEPAPEAVPAVADVEAWAQEGRLAYKKKDYGAAHPLLEQAARAGHTDSQYYLATMYLAARGVEKDPAQAADWFERASRRGHARAQYFLGGMYSGGFGRARDDTRAATLYQRAAEQGLAEGQFRIGLVYETGRGRSENPAEAVRWYRQAAEQGYGRALAALERRADDGDPTARDALRRLR